MILRASFEDSINEHAAEQNVSWIQDTEIILISLHKHNTKATMINDLKKSESGMEIQV